jgi:predicted amidohydrolase
MRRFPVSVLQYDVKRNPVENFKTIEKLFGIAAGRKSKFVVLPEMFATSFNHDEFNEFSKHSIEILKYLQQIALNYDFYIIAGSMPIKSSKDEKFFNRSYLISNEGAVIGYYDKNHIFFQNNELDYFNPGKSPSVFRTDLAQIGIQICFDVRFPENMRHLTKQGMQVLFVVAQFPNPRKDHWITLLKARAIENQVYVVACNRIGQSNENLSFFGESMIIDPHGEVLSNGSDKECVVTEYIDLDFMDAYRKSFPVLKSVR